jgi:pilus assembly protein CpaB
MALPNLPIKTGHLFIGLAVLMGIITMVLSGGDHKPPAPTTKIEAPALKTQSVVVPLLPIGHGKVLTLNDVTTVKWPSDFAPPNEIFEDANDVVGRIAKQDLFPGEPLFKEKLSGSNTGGGMPALIPNGLRAVTIAVTEIKGVGGFVKPGDRVDVISTFEIDRPGETGQRPRVTKTVLQNVLVLASAQTMVEEDKYHIQTPEGVKRGEATSTGSATASDDKAKDADKKDGDKATDTKPDAKPATDEAAKVVSSVTLALSPAQAETMALAEQTGEVLLSLRPETDHAVSRLHGVNSEQLTGVYHLPPKPPALSVSGKVPPVPPPFPGGMGVQVEFIQGTEKTLYSF